MPRRHPFSRRPWRRLASAAGLLAMVGALSGGTAATALPAPGFAQTVPVFRTPVAQTTPAPPNAIPTLPPDAPAPAQPQSEPTAPLAPLPTNAAEEPTVAAAKPAATVAPVPAPTSPPPTTDTPLPTIAPPPITEVPIPTLPVIPSPAAVGTQDTLAGNPLAFVGLVAVIVVAGAALGLRWRQSRGR